MPKIWVDLAAELSGEPLPDLLGEPHRALSIIPEVAYNLGFDGARLFLFPARRIEVDRGEVWETDGDGGRLGVVDIAGGLAIPPADPTRLDWRDPTTLFALQFRPARIPAEEFFDYSAVAVPRPSFYEAQGYGAAVRGVVAQYGDDLACIGDCDVPTLAFLARFRGVRQALIDVVEHLDWVEACFACGVEWAMARGKFFLDCGCHMLRVNDSMANMSLISADCWRRFIAPSFTEVCRRLHAYRPDALIYCHICGNVMPVMVDLQETGLDCIGPLDPLGGMDPAQARGAVGPGQALMGGVNTLTLASGSPEQVRAEALGVLRAVRAEQGAFVLGSGCVVPRSTSRANLEALREAGHSFCGGEADE